MLVCKVTLGTVKTVSRFAELKSLPWGYDSVREMIVTYDLRSQLAERYA